MVNLVPAIGELNVDRGKLEMGEVKGEPRLYGKCDFETDRKSGVIEVAEKLRGMVARTYLYMHYAYPGRLPLSQSVLNRMRKWHKMVGPTTAERVRNTLIKHMQGTSNPLVK